MQSITVSAAYFYFYFIYTSSLGLFFCGEKVVEPGFHLGLTVKRL